jgi:putative ABC transport system permease protein
MGGLLQDLKAGLRVLWRRPALGAAAVLILALGVGASGVLFHLDRAVLSRIPAVSGPERLVRIGERDPEGQPGAAAYPDLVDLRSQAGVFSGLAAFDTDSVALRIGQRTELLDALLVDPEYFEVLGLRPALGRLFGPAEVSDPSAVVLSQALWRRGFGADPGVLGTVVRLTGHPFTVVGVAPGGFDGLEPGRAPQLFVPMRAISIAVPGYNPLEDRKEVWASAVGRLAAGVTLEQARVAAEGLSRSLSREAPGREAGVHLALVPLAEAPSRLRSGFAPTLGLLSGAVGAVLLLAVANVAGLLLVQATGRRREAAVRLALGASRGRLVRQGLTELLPTVGLAAAGALLLLLAAPRLGPWLAPSTAALELDLSLDRAGVAFTLLLAVAAALPLGLVSLAHAGGSDLAEALRSTARGPAGGSRASRLRSALVVFQVALSLALMVGAGLLLRTLQAARAVDPGFDTRHVLTLRLDAGLAGLSPEDGRRLVERLVERVGAVPGARAAGVAQLVPLGFGDLQRSLFVEGRAYGSPEDGLPVNFNRIGPGFFEALGIGLLRGRGFGPQDGPEARPSVVLARSVAERLWPGQDPIGRRVGTMGPLGPYAEVVGVVEDVRTQRLLEEPPPYVYVPYEQNYAGRVTLLVRSEADPAALAGPVREAVQELAPEVPIFSVRPLAEYVEAQLWRQRLAAKVLGGFALLALLLAAAGLYGLMAVLVSERVPEIGVRMALGAAALDVAGMVVGRAARIAGLGLAAGLLLALAGTRLLGALLYGVKPFDVPTYGAVTGLLALTALGAAAWPAWRATRVDPAAALRE